MVDLIVSITSGGLESVQKRTLGLRSCDATMVIAVKWL